MHHHTKPSVSHQANLLPNSAVILIRMNLDRQIEAVVAAAIRVAGTIRVPQGDGSTLTQKQDHLFLAQAAHDDTPEMNQEFRELIIPDAETGIVHRTLAPLYLTAEAVQDAERYPGAWVLITLEDAPVNPRKIHLHKAVRWEVLDHKWEASPEAADEFPINVLGSMLPFSPRAGQIATIYPKSWNLMIEAFKILTNRSVDMFPPVHIEPLGSATMCLFAEAEMNARVRKETVTVASLLQRAAALAPGSRGEFMARLQAAKAQN